MLATSAWVALLQLHGTNSALSSVVKGDLVLNINILFIKKKKKKKISAKIMGFLEIFNITNVC